MARKKKKKEQTTSTSIAYQGTVRIKEIRGGKVYKETVQHNAGTAKLFQYIANCIVGNYNQSIMPRYIRLFKVTNPEQQAMSDNTKPNLWNVSSSASAINVPFDTAEVREDVNSTEVIEKPYISEFTFMIPANIISSSFNVICLYNVSEAANATPLAYLILDEEYVIPESNTSNLVIT